jgi:hypothetical protein
MAPAATIRPNKRTAPLSWAIRYSEKSASRASAQAHAGMAIRTEDAAGWTCGEEDIRVEPFLPCLVE